MNASILRIPLLPHDYNLWSLSQSLANSWADDLADMGQGQSCYTGHTSSLSGEYLYQVWNGSLQWKESYCMVQCPIFWQSHEQIVKSWADDIEDISQGQVIIHETPWLVVYNCTKYDKDPSNRRKTRMSRRKCHHLKSPQSLTVSSASRSCIVVVFYIRASYWLPSLSFHDNRASHSWDTIWPWKFKVKGTPVSAASRWLISLVFHIRPSNRLPSLSFHDNRASHSWDTICPWKFKVKGQGQRYPSQCRVQLTHSFT